MLFGRDESHDESIQQVTTFHPTFLKEDRSYLRQIHKVVSAAENSICMIYPWIGLGEELVIPFENAISNNPDVKLYLITRLLKGDVFRHLHQLEDVEQWRRIFKDNMSVKYNNNVHAKMIIVDDVAALVGSSNLTGTGLGSPRSYEGIPQIETNIYTTCLDAVNDAGNFFTKVWGHESSKPYVDTSEYVLSCKSHNLAGIFQHYKKDFKKLLETEDLTFLEDGTVKFKGDLAFITENEAYILGTKRKDIAVKFTGDTSKLNSTVLFERVEVSGNLHCKNEMDFTVKDITDKKGSKDKIEDKKVLKDKIIKINDLKSGWSNLTVSGTVSSSSDILELKGSGHVLRLARIEDDTGIITLELWNEKAQNKKIKKGSRIEIINGFTKMFRDELRLVIKKDGKIKVLKD
ncbi:phospholipase D-like domain-containing protein [Methanobacterium paludis]|uniref:Nucleic acid binding OB-fold tRNA/helicase-type n=1 Tax=Methanobacterium paludis (strain DSM 25820 / JCM 18151 / SWAN1) TaxID=868131 RepID=F6D7S5_METPW|nr:phospholipase D-like domain-containing protein [Methanobacterium paludis]AEG17763.1 nucleic acid binding OB-fold tRNA/helicase-type [Methanobacterium paludis]